MLTALPCGGFGELDPRGDSMRIICIAHRVWERDPHGHLIFDTSRTPDGRGEVRMFRFRDTIGCRAITDLDPASGVRHVVGFVAADAEAAE